MGLNRIKMVYIPTEPYRAYVGINELGESASFVYRICKFDKKNHFSQAHRPGLVGDFEAGEFILKMPHWPVLSYLVKFRILEGLCQCCYFIFLMSVRISGNRRRKLIQCIYRFNSIKALKTFVPKFVQELRIIEDFWIPCMQVGINIFIDFELRYHLSALFVYEKRNESSHCHSPCFSPRYYWFNLHQKEASGYCEQREYSWHEPLFFVRNIR